MSVDEPQAHPPVWKCRVQMCKVCCIRDCKLQCPTHYGPINNPEYRCPECNVDSFSEQIEPYDEDAMREYGERMLEASRWGELGCCVCNEFFVEEDVTFREGMNGLVCERCWESRNEPT